MTRPGTVTAALPAEVVARLGADGSLTVEEQRFALVPEWMIDAQVTDTAFRLYAVLLRYGGSSGRRMPSRALLARRLHRSVDTVDRALRELETYAIVRVERRRDGRQNLTNCYHLRTTDPAAPSPARTGGGRSAAATTPHASVPEQDGAREGRGSSAATPPPNGAAGRGAAAGPGRTAAEEVAATVRPDPKPLTETPPPAPHPVLWSPPDAPTAALLTACGIRDLGLLAARCAQLRRNLGQAAGCWSAPALLPAVQLAVIHRQHPAGQVVAALLAVAADPVTRSPMRVAEAGPWWTPAPGVAAAPVVEDPELAALEARLAATDGRRPTLQAKARAQLAAEREPVTRAAVARRACALLDAEQDDAEQDEAEHNDDQADHDEGEDVGA